ncbi:hypothetical protein H0E87_022547 [Populus deltoides]|uniref:Uncharacterized protein n=1 Tax=Populus deltoides TaxID=3696 RepID=A0A8T2XD26_POPDE|nr:hypothetical protein H0E87_022547 [Populus deltoides]
MDLWAVHVKNTTGSPFCLRNHSIPEKSFVSSNFGKFRVLKHKISSSGYHSLGVKAMAKKNSNDNSNSSSPSPSAYSSPLRDGCMCAFLPDFPIVEMEMAQKEVTLLMGTNPTTMLPKSLTG